MRTSWDPFRDLEEMRRDLERVFQTPGGVPRLPRWRSVFLPGRASRAYPMLNLSEDQNNIYVQALAPGLNPDSIDISVVQGQLRISGEKPGMGDEVSPESYHRSERAAGRFARSVSLPAAVNQDKASAEYKNGILNIRLPKAEEAKPRQITVKA